MKIDKTNETLSLREQVRKTEFESVRQFFKPQTRVLELGGGNGYQAALIASMGCDIMSIDIADRVMPPKLAFPVRNYDGQNIPADDNAFDLVYSSNVLEHIVDVPRTLAEVRRVLRPGGIVIHFLPSPAWRFWNSAAHFLNILRRIASSKPETTNSVEQSPSPKINGTATCKRLLSALSWCFLGALRPHGEYSNALVELFLYRRSRWRAIFEDAGFSLSQIDGNGLFYSGYFITPLKIDTRRRISKLMGQSCSVFIMKSQSHE